MAIDRHEATLPTEPLHAMLACSAAAWQLPFILYTGWWNALANAELGDVRYPWFCHWGNRGDDHQLAVPEPIEGEGEHALFA
ncbi:MAG: hypothetical protein ACOY45_12090 [Pseudomonadota bacterium]